MSAGQAAFRAALFDPRAPHPAGLTGPGGRPAGRRFDVYRNNVVASLAAALEAGFPALRALLGPEAFRGIAVAHARAHPPGSPCMMHYGQDLPAFLEATTPHGGSSALPDRALPDLARLELAIRESYHAADAVPVDAAALGAVAQADLPALRIATAPALRLVASRHPIVTLRRLALEGGASETPDAPDGSGLPEARGETALVTRPGFDPQVCALVPGDAAFVAALSGGAPLAEAAEAGAAREPGYTPAAALSALLRGGAIVSLDTEPAP